MKKIITLITGILLSSLYVNVVFAENFSFDETNEYSDDLFEDFGNSGGEFDIFDSDSENVNGSMYMTGEKLDRDIFKLTVAAKQITNPILGVAFHLLYENDKLAFLKYDPGDFLERGGDPFYLVKNDEDLNKLVFGETLRKNDTFPVGDGIISAFYFQVLEGDDFNFEFKNGVISTLDTIRQDLDRISWENFSFDKNSNEPGDFAKASTLDVESFDYSSLIIGIIMVIAACPAVYFIIRLIKKHSSLNFPPQTN